MRTDLLRAFAVVAEECHFGRAADRLHIGQSPLSQQIRRLERELGTPLLVRSTRRVELTPAGEMVRDRAQPLLHELDRLSEDARRIAEGKLGRIAIGFTGSATFSIMPGLANRLREELPLVALDLHGELLTPAQVTRLINRELDIGMLRPPVREPGIRLEIIDHEPLLVVLPSGHPLTAQPAVDLSELAGIPFISYPSESRSVIHDAVERACQQHGFHPQVQLEVAETATLVAFVAAGLGISLVPARVRNLAINGATYRPLVGQGPTVELAVAWREDRDGPLIKNTLDVIRRHIASTAGRASGEWSPSQHA
jgi:DNA-binding transcriptional LysR family regulator